MLIKCLSLWDKVVKRMYKMINILVHYKITTYGSNTSLVMYSLGILGNWWEKTFCRPISQTRVCLEGFLLRLFPTTWNSITPLFSSRLAASSRATWAGKRVGCWRRKFHTLKHLLKLKKILLIKFRIVNIFTFGHHFPVSLQIFIYKNFYRFSRALSARYYYLANSCITTNSIFFLLIDLFHIIL